MNKLYYLLVIPYLFLSFRVSAQDLGAIGKDKKPFKVRGSISASQVLYTADGIPNRRNPYNYFLSGNLSFSIYGWTVPLSYIFSNQQSQFQQPFNQYGITPYYKWIKLYAGYTSMSFSSYTMNGYIFLGGGIQLTPPGLFRMSAMYGRLNKAIEEDTSNASSLPAYQRMGGGFKIGIGKGSDGLDLVFFTAKDDVLSLHKPLQKSQITPGENVVMSLIGTKQLFKRVMLSGEYAASAVSSDIRSDKNEGIGKSVFSADPYFTFRYSTAIYKAYKANLNYSAKTYSVGIGFEHIDPGYKTYGAYYFNDDLENYTINATKRLLDGRLNLAANTGVQKNNLRGDKVSSMNRVVFGGNFSFTATQRINLFGGYTNFQTYTRVRTLSQLENANLPKELNGNPDTLNFAQLSQSANLGSTVALTDPKNKQLRNMLSINLLFQTAGEARSNQNVNFGTRFYNGTLSYNRSMIPQALSMTFALNTNVNELAGTKNILVGPSVTLSKSFFEKKLKATGSTSWTSSYTAGIKINDIVNIRMGGTYTFLKKHNVNCNMTVIYRNSANSSASLSSSSAASDKKVISFTEYTANMGYSYSF